MEWLWGLVLGILLGIVGWFAGRASLSRRLETLRNERETADRGWSDGELARRERNQLAIAEKRRLSSWVIVNDGSLQQLTETIDQRWSSLLSRQAELTTNPRCLSTER